MLLTGYSYVGIPRTTETIGLIVATKRIQRFLLREEIDDTQVIRDKSNNDSDENVIEIKNAVLSWTSGNPIEEEEEEEDEDTDGESEETNGDNPHESDRLLSEQQNQPSRPILQNINLRVKDKSLTAVVGRVGQGKSSLLSAIIGEMYKLQGSIRVRGRIAYVPQQAWILNATLKDNILFGNAYDPERYRQVVRVCGLEPDLAILPAGDQTEIGERGINLSGGQKQRVSLARAAYNDADVYLLDDPLSAVDAHVDRHLWDNLIGPEGMLKDKTRILVTHGIHHLEHVDQIVVIKEGTIAELGNYEELMSSKQSFYQLIKEYSAKHSFKRRNSQAVSLKRRNSQAVSLKRKNSQAAAAPGTTTVAPGHEHADGQLLPDIPLSEQPDDLEDMSDESEGDSSATVEEDTDISLKKAAEKNHATEAGEDEDEDELIAEEVLKKGHIEWRLIKAYVKACTVKISVVIVLSNLTAQMCMLGSSLWLKHWISKSKEELQEAIFLFLGALAGFTLVYVMSYILFVYLALAVARIKASESIHARLVSTVIRLPMR